MAMLLPAKTALPVALALFVLAMTPGNASGKDDQTAALAAPFGSAARYWEPEVYTATRFDDQHMVAAAGMLVPFSRQPDRLLFADASGRRTEFETWEGDIGFGYRRLLAEGHTLVGGYGYLDEVRSDLGNSFRQVTVGMELQAEYWSVRGQHYFVDAHRSRDEGDGVTTADLSSVVEHGFDGWDVELGSRLPVTVRAHELWVYGAYYQFEASGWESVAGPRVRLDWRIPLDWATVGARLGLGLEWKRDASRGEQQMASIRFVVPMGAAAGAAHSSFRVSHWSRTRMAEPPIRALDVVTGSRSSSSGL